MVRSTFCAAATLAANGVDAVPVAVRVEDRRGVVDRSVVPRRAVFVRLDECFAGDTLEVRLFALAWLPPRRLPVLPVDFVDVAITISCQCTSSCSSRVPGSPLTTRFHACGVVID